MITDSGAAALCNAIYDASDLLHPEFEVFASDGGICRGLTRRDDCDVITFRGSKTLSDWWADLHAEPYDSRRMGRIHRGFYLGMNNVWADLKPLLRPHLPIVITGHSLGAARAAVLTGMMIADGMPPARRVTFGEPKPGFQEFADFIRDVPATVYRNGNGEAHDLVTDVPLLPWMPYVHTTKLTYVNAPPAIDDPGGIFAWHHMPLYAAGLAALVA